MSQTFEGTITGLSEWQFSDDADLNKYVENCMVDALNDMLPDAACLWLTDKPLGFHFYLNLSDATAEVSWKRPLAEIVLEQIEDWLPGGNAGLHPIDEETKARAAQVAQGLREIADSVDAFMASQERTRAKEAQEGEE